MGFKELSQKTQFAMLIDKFSQNKNNTFLNTEYEYRLSSDGGKFPAAISQPVTAMNRRQAGRWVDELQNSD